MRGRDIRSLPITFLPVVLMGTISGCAQPPVKQLEATKKAIELARAAGGAEYAPANLVKLEREFALAKEELIGQEHVLSIFQSYVDAEELLDNVRAEARQVEVNAAHNKEMAKAIARVVEK